MKFTAAVCRSVSGYGLEGSASSASRALGRGIVRRLPRLETVQPTGNLLFDAGQTGESGPAGGAQFFDHGGAICLIDVDHECPPG
jgi:hypothetical protein